MPKKSEKIILILIAIAFVYFLGFVNGHIVRPEIVKTQYPVYITKEEEACTQAGGTMKYNFSLDDAAIPQLSDWKCVVPSKVINHS